MQRVAVRSVLAVLLLAGVACSGDPEPGGSSPSPRDTGSGPAASGAPPVDVPAPGSNGDVGEGSAATPVPVTSDDPAATVQAFLDAIVAEDYVTQLALTAEGPKILTRTRDIIRQVNTEIGGTTTNVVDVTSTPSTTDNDGRSAVVAVDVTVTSTVSGDRGTSESAARITTPVTLKRSDDRWLITDFVYADRPLAPFYHPTAARQTKKGATLEVGGVVSYKETTATVIRLLGEDEDEGFGLSIRRVALFDVDGAEHVADQLVPEPKNTPAIFIGTPRFDGTPARIVVEVQRPDTEETWTFDVTL